MTKEQQHNVYIVFSFGRTALVVYGKHLGVTSLHLYARMCDVVETLYDTGYIYNYIF